MWGDAIDLARANNRQRILVNGIKGPAADRRKQGNLRAGVQDLVLAGELVIDGQGGALEQGGQGWAGRGEEAAMEPRMSWRQSSEPWTKLTSGPLGRSRKLGVYPPASSSPSQPRV